MRAASAASEKPIRESSRDENIVLGAGTLPSVADVETRMRMARNSRASGRDARLARPGWQKSRLRRLFDVLTGEWMLRNGRPNGGDVVLCRSFQVAVVIYVPAMVLSSWAKSAWSFQFDSRELGRALAETLPWLGAIFAGAYVALYTRFSAQWGYLAGVYNQIMSTMASLPNDGAERQDHMDTWMAGFIEDAVTLHLATKRIFAESIWESLRDDGIRALLDGSKTFGIELRTDLEKALQRRHPELEPLVLGATKPERQTPRE